MFQKIDFRKPFFFRPPAQAALRWRAHFSKTALPTLENPRLLPVDRPYFLVVESENEVLPMLDAFSRFVPYRPAAFWAPRKNGFWRRALSFLANGIHVADGAEELAALMTPKLQRAPTWAEINAVFAALGGEKADNAILSTPQIRAFFDAMGGMQAARMAFDRMRARSLEESVRIHRETMVQKNCAVIVSWKRSSLLAEPAPLWLPIAQAVGERVFSAMHRREKENQIVFRVLPSLDSAAAENDEPEWVRRARELWLRSCPSES